MALRRFIIVTTRRLRELAAAGLAVLLFAVPPGAGEALAADATWNGGTGDWDTAANWTPAVVPNNGGTTFNVLIDGGKTGTDSVVHLTISNPKIDNLTIDTGDRLDISNGRILVSPREPPRA